MIYDGVSKQSFSLYVFWGATVVGLGAQAIVFQLGWFSGQMHGEALFYYVKPTVLE